LENLFLRKFEFSFQKLLSYLLIMDTSSKPLEVVLTKLEDRFSLKLDYDDDLRKLIKSQKSYFDRDFKEWSLPNTSRKII
jgi:hypothetical protein